MENLRKIIREAVIQVLENVNQIPTGVVDGKGQQIRTGRMIRPLDASDKRWGQVAGITIDLKVRVNWTDPDSKHKNQKETAENPKNMEMY